MGNGALYRNTTGGDNIALGYFTLWNNTTGNSNVGLGASVLNANTTGSQNTGTGILSLESNTTGYNNTANGIFHCKVIQQDLTTLLSVLTLCGQTPPETIILLWVLELMLHRAI